MRWKALLWCSLGLNVALAIMLLVVNRATQEIDSSASGLTWRRNISASAKPPSPHVVVRRIPFTWKDIESEDYREYIQNLRHIECPESTIRDIIIADVDNAFASRQQSEVITYEHEWWRSDPSFDYASIIAERTRELQAQRRDLLTSLLGPQWEQPALPPTPPVIARESFLAGLAENQVTAVQAIHASGRERLAAYAQEARVRGEVADEAGMAQIRQEIRAALAATLEPSQVEEFLLRYSDTAGTLRSELRGFDATKDEFLQIFRARERHDEQLARLSGNDPATQQSRALAMRMRDEGIRQALGPERYPVYEMNQQPLFREARASAEKIGAPAESVLPLYAINQAISEERQRIQNDQQMTSVQRAAALQEVADQQAEALKALLGDTSYTTYTELNSAGTR